MAVRREKYKDINVTLRALREQVIDSYEYCKEHFQFRDPDEMFWVLKSNVKYKNDPPQVELLQTADTLFDNNWHGSRGAGDCDCFTILVLACCMVNGWTQNKIVLAGRKKSAPSHIYSRTLFNDKWYTIDLTEPVINSERYYPYKQDLNV